MGTDGGIERARALGLDHSSVDELSSQNLVNAKLFIHSHPQFSPVLNKDYTHFVDQKAEVQRYSDPGLSQGHHVAFAPNHKRSQL